MMIILQVVFGLVNVKGYTFRVPQWAGYAQLEFNSLN